MFACDRCKKVTASGEKRHLVVVRYREVTYPPITRNDEYGEYEYIPKGKEIEDTTVLCESCFREHQKKEQK